ncbi:two-component system activity regulator YycH [Lactobacillus sp. ESL0785]|uniref:two-component system activity regulator YycH n=1 Tax=Lactobacillus sp. ESL0785 TaxID=2983232 RepID=UPI0023F9DEC0|nr:two-component system activity regulator YycH [Lactobacillus sp. ESL0785]WEV70953.1 two-component system activity regulator YycH [Lactobacillus sp. ESL0785]
MIGMRSKFKLGDFLLLLSTLAVFVLSIILWIFIMTNDQYFNHISQTNNLTQQARGRRNNSIYDLYIPTSSYGFKEDQPYRLYDAKKNIPLEFIRELRGIKFKKSTQVSTTQFKYEQLLNDADYLQLTFPDEISLNLFTRKNLQNDNAHFRRIFISRSNRWLYLGNDKTYTVYRVALARANFDKLRSYARGAHSKTPIKFVRLKNCYEVFYTQASRWRVYSYLTNTQTDSYFVSRLLGTANVTARSSKKGWITYTLNYYTKLRVPKANTKRHDFLYTRYEKNKAVTKNERLFASVNYVHKLGLSEQDLRFFDTNGDATSYTNYIEGIPVFLGQHTPQVKTMLTTEAMQVAFNNIDLQIPIPFDGQTRNLPATDTVLQKLFASGMKRSQIQRIIVAFRLTKDNSHGHLVNLIPTYYVKANNEWKSLAEWQRQSLQPVAKTNNQ